MEVLLDNVNIHCQKKFVVQRNRFKLLYVCSNQQVSVLILVFLSMERFLLIAVPLGGHQNMSMKTTCLSLSVIWTAGLSFASIPGNSCCSNILITGV